MKSIIDRLYQNKLLILSTEDFSDIILQCEIIKEENTYLSGMIRILKYDSYIITQEENTKNEIILRLTRSLKEAEDFIKSRLETYNNMWDGCGCKVNYYE